MARFPPDRALRYVIADVLLIMSIDLIVDHYEDEMQRVLAGMVNKKGHPEGVAFFRLMAKGPLWDPLFIWRARRD